MRRLTTRTILHFAGRDCAGRAPWVRPAALTQGGADICVEMVGLSQHIADQMIEMPFRMGIRVAFYFIEQSVRFVIKQFAIHQR